MKESIYKVVDQYIYVGSTNKLFDYEASASEVNEYFRDRTDDLEFFGNDFDCEPIGGRASNWVFNIVD